jgi:class 3 adenylate cyclase
MDAAGIERAAPFSVADGARMAMLFAASFPARTTHLIVMTSAARFLRADDYPEGVTQERYERMLNAIGEHWGTGAIMEMWAPSQIENPEFRRWWSRYQRASASPQMGQAALRATIEIDVRHVLPAIRVPTLVLQRRDNPLVTAANGRYIAKQIAGARYVEVPGADFFPWTAHSELVLHETEAFMTGHSSEEEPDRVLVTVLFTDIVDSTQLAAELGDRSWAALLDTHNELVRRELSRHRGVEIGTTGDGFLATFDGPARAVRCACAIRDAVRPLGIEVRAGLHTGEIEWRGDGVSGIAIHTGARVASQAAAGEVLLSRTVADLIVGSNISLRDGGRHPLKGVPGDWQLYSVVTA